LVRLLIAGDLHCGHLLGLTPKENISNKFILKKLMDDFWAWWKNETKGTWDIAFWMGDLIDGEGKKDTTHLLFPSVEDQIDTAVNIIHQIGADQNIFVYGTPYHISENLDYERMIAKEFGGDIETYQKKSIQGIKFDLAHSIGKTNTPTGGDIMVKKEILWALLNDISNSSVDYVIRGHAHEYRKVEMEYISGIICPALKIGDPNFDRYARKIRGWYTVGFLEMQIEKGKVINFIKHFYRYKIKSGYEELWKQQR